MDGVNTMERDGMGTAGGGRPRVVVVGAGVAGLAAAHALRTEAPEVEVTVLEREGRAGGLVETERTDDGFVIEHGPDSMVTFKPEGVALAEALGLDGDVVAGRTDLSTFVVRHGELVPLPQGLMAFAPTAVMPVLRSPLLTLRGKARLLVEPLVPRRREEGDETVASFVGRRLGNEMLDRLVNPLVRGVFGAPADRLSLGAVLPKLAAMEREHGSVGLAALRARRERDREKRPRPTAGAGAPRPPVVSFRAGMGQLTDALSATLGETLRLGQGVARIERRGGGGFALTLDDGGRLEADGLVLAVPAHAAARMLEPLDPELACELGAVRHTELDAVTLAYARAHVPGPLESTGFIVPASEGRALTACTLSSSKWSGRGPDDTVLLRCFLGVGRDEAEAVAAARADLRDLMGIEAAPRLVRRRRRSDVLPIREIGHIERMARVGARAAQLPGLALAGGALGTVGIPDCIRTGREAARRVRSEGAPVHVAAE